MIHAEERVAGNRRTMPNTLQVDHEWTFLTNHAHVLVCIALSPDVTMREIASQVGITERAVQRIVADLSESGYLVRERDGRRNRYLVRTYLPLRHPLEKHVQVSAILNQILAPPRRE